MKFIELTDYHTNKTMLVNLEKVVKIINGHTSGFMKMSNVLIEFGNEEYMYVKESYEDIKEIIENI